MPRCRPLQTRPSRSSRVEQVSSRLRFEENCLRTVASFQLRERRMGMPVKICTEADYLLAHLTAIAPESRITNQTVHHFKTRITSVLKKWIVYAVVPPWLSRPE